MTYFEMNGVNLQNQARNVKEADKRFSVSCTMCCQRGMQIDCDRCAIALANAQRVKVLKELDEGRMSRLAEEFVNAYRAGKINIQVNFA